jgi:threonine dehydrogenase-like Zn-dependent dehydrogenase
VRALVLSGPRTAAVIEVPSPTAGPGQVVVDVERVGVCGTDVEFFRGEMAYLHQGDAVYPMRLGHEWCGRVSSIGEAVDSTWLGRRVTGDTMLGCGRCHRCERGNHHLCAERFEVGIRGGWPGALAEQLAVRVSSLHVLPDSVDATAGAMVEPGGNALRAFAAAALEPGDRLMVIGPGTIGLLVALFGIAHRCEVHVAGVTDISLAFAETIGVHAAWRFGEVPGMRFDAVIDASNSAEAPRRAVEMVEPGRRVVFIGLAGSSSRLDSRDLVLNDVTAIGILGGSAGLAGAIEHFASHDVDPRPLVAATVGLDAVGNVLAGERPDGAGPGPKIHVDPRLEGM